MFVWRWLQNVPLVDPVERRLAPLFQLVLLALGVALGIAFVERLVRSGPADFPANGVSNTILFISGLLSMLALVRRGYFKVAAWLLLLLLFLLTVSNFLQVTSIVNAGGGRLMAFFLPFTVAGVFLNRRAVLFVFITSIAVILLAYRVGTLDIGIAVNFILNAALVSFLIDLLKTTLRGELLTALIRNQELEDTRKSLENYASELFKVNERLNITLRSIGDAVITSDAEGRVLLINDVAEELTGWTQAEAQGQPLSTIFNIINEYTRETVESPADKVMREGVVVGLANHTLLIKKDGQEIPIDDSGAPIRDNTGKISGVVLVFRDITERKEAELQEKEVIALNERHRLARDLHDSVSQVLFAANVIAESLPRLMERNPERGRQQMEQLHQLTQGAIAEMRKLLFELRPEQVINTRLEELMNQLAQALRSRKNIPVSFIIKDTSEQPVPDDVHVTFYRVAQESLNNIVRHGNATEVRVRLTRTPEFKELIIVDNGDGFDTSVTASGFGLTSMRERAASINADLKIQSRVGTGTKITLLWKRTETAAGK